MYYFLKKNCPFTESFQVVSVLKVLKLNLMNNHQTNKQKNNRQLAQTFIAKVIVYNGARRERKKNKVPPFFSPCGLYSSEHFQEMDTKKTVLTPY